MQTTFALVLLGAALALAVQYEGVNSNMINEINSNPKSTWKAGHNKFWEQKSLNSMKYNFGWVKSKKSTVERKEIKVPTFLPTNFDSRTKWAQCQTLRSIYNQAECGSCWAFGAVEAISDRYCIHLNKQVLLSFQEMVTCNDNCDGCEGGDAGLAWQYARNQGLVSSACSPYTIPTCPPSQQPCLNFVDTPDCVKKCESNSSLVWSQDLHYLSSVYGVSGEQQIMTEIYNNGPVEACFEVYEDFLHYKKGVYQHTTGSDLGGHCVKMMGWGVENGTPYWLCANSWTTYWGNKGYFKIRRGTDECGIEDDIVAGIPSMTPPSTTSSGSSSSGSSSGMHIF